MDIEKINTKMTIMKKKTSYIPPSSIAIKLDESLMLGIGSGKTKPEDSDAKRHVGFDVESEADGGGTFGYQPVVGQKTYDPWED